MKKIIGIRPVERIQPVLHTKLDLKNESEKRRQAQYNTFRDAMHQEMARQKRQERDNYVPSTEGLEMQQTGVVKKLTLTPNYNQNGTLI